MGAESVTLESLGTRRTRMKYRVAKIKKHFRDNKGTYIGVGAGIVVGAASAVVLMNRATMISNKEVLNFKWQSPTTNVLQLILPALGDPGNVVQCVETGSIYASQGQAAKELGVSATDVSNHLHGKNPHLNGLHLKVLGKAGQPLAG